VYAAATTPVPTPAVGGRGCFGWLRSWSWWPPWAGPSGGRSLPSRPGTGQMPMWTAADDICHQHPGTCASTGSPRRGRGWRSGCG